MMVKYAKRPNTDKNAGAIAVDLEGKPVAQYYDVHASQITTGIKIGEHLYFGSLSASYIIRLNLTQYPAAAA